MATAAYMVDNNEDELSGILLGLPTSHVTPGGS